MAHDASKVQQIVDGFIYLAPYGATAPTSADSVLDSAWKEIGYYSDEGYEVTPEPGDTTEITGHNGNVVVESQKPGNWVVKFSGLEARKEIVEAYFEATVNSDGSYLVPSAAITTKRALIVKGIDQDGDLALDYYPEVKVSDREALQGTLEDARKYGLSFKTFRNAALGGHFKGWNQKLANTELDPVISAITPSGADEDEIVQITGVGFTGATAVEFAESAANDFTVISDALIVATLPSGSAGSVAVEVTTPVGTSDPFSYTRAGA